MRGLYKILVEIPEGKLLRFTISKYEKINNKIYFVDSKTGLKKEFPDSWCAIEEMSEARDYGFKE